MSADFPKDLASHVHGQLVHRKQIPPSTKVLTKLFETLYFASLKREETQPISCRVLSSTARIQTHIHRTGKSLTDGDSFLLLTIYL